MYPWLVTVNIANIFAGRFVDVWRLLVFSYFLVTCCVSIALQVNTL